jgi:hypothetical protein
MYSRFKLFGAMTLWRKKACPIMNEDAIESSRLILLLLIRAL